MDTASASMNRAVSGVRNLLVEQLQSYGLIHFIAFAVVILFFLWLFRLFY